MEIMHVILIFPSVRPSFSPSNQSKLDPAITQNVQFLNSTYPLRALNFPTSADERLFRPAMLLLEVRFTMDF